ncbi:hypothetical protein Taro_033342 [Colocasia esculenta]|uniref:Uncharacterized protein n=1 Tax=Colocasia esculenta TaxID=4460 RepID=A0A843VXM3_COLES|nr:hypothetical protein [Colocasia esculenta]
MFRHSWYQSKKFLKWQIEEIGVVEVMIRRRVLSPQAGRGRGAPQQRGRGRVMAITRAQAEASNIIEGGDTTMCRVPNRCRFLKNPSRKNSHTFCSAGGGAVEGFSGDFGWRARFSARFCCKELVWSVRITGEASYCVFFAKFPTEPVTREAHTYSHRRGRGGRFTTVVQFGAAS